MNQLARAGSRQEEFFHVFAHLPLHYIESF